MFETHTLMFQDSELEIVPELGCNPIRLVIDGQSVLDGNNDPEKLKSDFLCKGDFLAPFPNRVSEGKYTFNGEEYELQKNEEARGHALHGFIMKKKFMIVRSEEGDDFSRAQFETHIDAHEFPGYPFEIQVGIIFTLSVNELHIEMTGTNLGSIEAPFGLGWHPYLTVGKKLDECGLLIPAISTLETDSQKELIPTGKHLPNTFGTLMRPIGTETFDTCFVDLTGQTVLFENIELFFEESMKYLQIYTPEERMSIAIEPMSCAPDAFNNGLGLVTLSPGESMTREFGIRLRV